MGKGNPKVKLVPARLDKYLDLVSFCLLMIFWIYTIISYFSLPNTIPIHYNFKGIVDGVGSKLTIFILPVIITLVFMLMTFLNRYPHIFNYPVTITPENAPKQYSLATRILRILKLVIVLFCLFIDYKIINYKQASSSQLGWWFLPLFIGSIILPTFYFIHKSFRAKNELTKP